MFLCEGPTEKSFEYHVSILIGVYVKEGFWILKPLVGKQNILLTSASEEKVVRLQGKDFQWLTEGNINLIDYHGDI